MQRFLRFIRLSREQLAEVTWLSVTVMRNAYVKAHRAK